jgi:hypothetical protein
MLVHLRIATRLALLACLLTVLIALTGALGVGGMRSLEQGLRIVYQERTVTIRTSSLQIQVVMTISDRSKVPEMLDRVATSWAVVAPPVEARSPS